MTLTSWLFEMNFCFLMIYESSDNWTNKESWAHLMPFIILLLLNSKTFERFTLFHHPPPSPSAVCNCLYHGFSFSHRKKCPFRLVKKTSPVILHVFINLGLTYTLHHNPNINPHLTYVFVNNSIYLSVSLVSLPYLPWLFKPAVTNWGLISLHL